MSSLCVSLSFSLSLSEALPLHTDAVGYSLQHVHKEWFLVPSSHPCTLRRRCGQFLANAVVDAESLTVL